MKRLSLVIGVALSLLASPAMAGDDECVNAATAASKLRLEKQKILLRRERLRACAADACHPVIREDCRKELVELAATVPSVLLVAEEQGGGQVFDVRVTIDGSASAVQLDGEPVELDPGVHTFVFTREGEPPIEVRVVLGPGQAAPVRAQFPRRSTAPTSPTSPPRMPTPDAAAEDALTPPVQAGPLRSAGLVLGGVGVLGLGIGAFFGLRAASKQSEAGCPNNVCDPSNGGRPESLKEAQSAGNLSTLFFVGGGVLAGGGLAMYLLAPRSPAGPAARVRPVVGPNAAAIVLEGAAF